MRRSLIAGNWKMNLDREASVALAKQIAEGGGTHDCDVAVCPTFVYLDAVYQALKSSPVQVGGQNLYPQPSGAFTGEISPQMLVDVGCRYVILGHSERRQLMGETDSQVNAKVRAALGTQLTPIVCVGETLAQREAGSTTKVVRGQFEQSLADVPAERMAEIVIAYEPVWAIGTGKVATPQQAQEVHSDLRKVIETHYNAEVASAVRILYGGSVKPANASELLAQSDIDGALVGGASLVASDFLAIIEAA